MLYFIGIGLGNEKDLTLNALDILKSCSFVYLEGYTSALGFDIKKLEDIIGKSVVLADRDIVENRDDIVENAKENNVAFLIKGDVFSATTHADLFLRAKKNGVECRVLHNSSILTAVGDCGLSLYKFGKVASIPFHNENIESAFSVLSENKGMHTLFLLDLKEGKYMNFKDGFSYLLRNGLNEDTMAVVLAAIGTEKSEIKYGKIKELQNIEINAYPQCIIIPGKLHFMEEDMLNNFRI